MMIKRRYFSHDVALARVSYRVRGSTLNNLRRLEEYARATENKRRHFSSAESLVFASKESKSRAVRVSDDCMEVQSVYLVTNQLIRLKEPCVYLIFGFHALVWNRWKVEVSDPIHDSIGALKAQDSVFVLELHKISFYPRPRCYTVK